MCLAQSCGKCVPCRVGLEQLEKLLESVLDGEAELETIDPHSVLLLLIYSFFLLSIVIDYIKICLINLTIINTLGTS